MVRPDWDKFKAKFSEDKEGNFQRLCYLLFCKEFNKPHGIFSYFNQSGMETNPVQSGNDCVAWEAKFYDDKNLSQRHVDAFINKINIASKKNPEVTKLLFYTPISWTESSDKTKRKTQAQEEVEQAAAELNIDIEWRSTSYFEKVCADKENKLIAQHFFSSDKETTILALLERKKDHTQRILDNIQEHIEFTGKNISINRDEVLEQLRDNLCKKRVVIISGSGGTGKSVTLKQFYEEKKSSPFYVFRAYDFQLNNINELFKPLTLRDFIKAHEEESEKIIVIDAAEKLGDLNNQEVVKDFLGEVYKNGWTLLFTARDRYFNDLLPDFCEYYKIPFFDIHIDDLTLDELNELGNKNGFKLPSSDKLCKLLKTPFYLKEYLRFYKEDEELDYLSFKERLWNKNILKNKPTRERCFLEIASERSNNNLFYINPDCDPKILDEELVKDGILMYETAGYFIAHDIYEEWALEKIVERAYVNKSDNESFFNDLGDSLPMRRSLRSWISEKILLNDKGIKSFINEVIVNQNIKQRWKDEVLVSILLTEYADTFFQEFKDKLLQSPPESVKFNDSSEFVRSLTISYKYEKSILHRIFFLLRIACKEVDQDFSEQLGLKNVDLFTLKYVWTKPKGQGWKSVIKFIFENFDEIGIQNMHFVLPIVHDWVGKYKQGETTKFSGLIALKYYQWIIKRNTYVSSDETKDKLMQTIAYSSSEIKTELEDILKEVIKNKWKNHGDPYADLSEVILTKLESFSVATILPQYVLQMMDVFWSFTPKDDPYYGRPGIGMEEHFGMEDEHLEYFPVSSYQTPIYWLLQSSLQETVDFILRFTNKVVDHFAKTEFAKYEVYEVEVSVGNEKVIKQYSSRNGRLWNMYRGSSAPAPKALQSMHMALERFFLDNGKNIDSKTLEGWLLYLISNSKSVSISAVVTSIVLAYPDKTFNIAKILFRTKDFFLEDTSRLILDQGQKGLLESLRMFGSSSKNEFYEEERLKACDDKHRRLSLENLFLNYQLFRNEEISEEESENRQKILWGILDEYYKKLPDQSRETESDKTWRLYLARMDRRKMNIVSEESTDGYLINFNPEIEPTLKEWSEKSLKENSEPMANSDLLAWAKLKGQRDKRYKEYKEYEGNPEVALKKVKTIVSKLQKIKKPECYSSSHSKEESFYLFNNAIPAEVCSVLLRDHLKDLPEKEIDFCKDLILKYADLSTKFYYQPQTQDGVRAAIRTLPVIFKNIPEDRKYVKKVLFFILFNSYPVDMSGNRFNAFSVMAIHELWNSSPEDAHSLLLGYLLLKPKHSLLREKIRQENYKKNVYHFEEDEFEERFLKESKDDLEKILNNELSIEDLDSLEGVDLDVLEVAFSLIPIETIDREHEAIIKSIISIFAKHLLSYKKEDRVMYTSRHNFLERLAYFTLKLPQDRIEEFLKPFLDNFTETDAVSDLFQEFVSVEDKLGVIDNFWYIWELFYDKVVTLCKKDDERWYSGRIIKSYLFANNSWKPDAIGWHTFRKEDGKFFIKMSNDMKDSPSVLYAISKLLYGIGASYLEQGISWVSSMLKDNVILSKRELEVDTIYYLENIIKNYIYNNREGIKKNKEVKQKVLVILDFLVEKESVLAYMLRENIL